MTRSYFLGKGDFYQLLTHFRCRPFPLSTADSSRLEKEPQRLMGTRVVRAQLLFCSGSEKVREGNIQGLCWRLALALKHREHPVLFFCFLFRKGGEKKLPAAGRVMQLENALAGKSVQFLTSEESLHPSRTMKKYLAVQFSINPAGLFLCKAASMAPGAPDSLQKELIWSA